MSFTVTVEGLKTVDDFLEQFPRRTGQALLRALKRGGDAARTHSNRVAAKDIGIKVGDVRKRTSTRVVASDLVAEVRGSLTRIPLIELGAKGPYPSRGRGVVRVKGRVYKGAFIAFVGRGHKGVFARKPGANRRGPAPNRSQLPIRELRRQSVGRAMDVRKEEILNHGADVVERETDRLLARIIGGSVA